MMTDEHLDMSRRRLQVQDQHPRFNHIQKAYAKASAKPDVYETPKVSRVEGFKRSHVAGFRLGFKIYVLGLTCLVLSVLL